MGGAIVGSTQVQADGDDTLAEVAGVGAVQHRAPVVCRRDGGVHMEAAFGAGVHPRVPGHVDTVRLSTILHRAGRCGRAMDEVKVDLWCSGRQELNAEHSNARQVFGRKGAPSPEKKQFCVTNTDCSKHPAVGG